MGGSADLGFGSRSSHSLMSLASLRYVPRSCFQVFPGSAHPHEAQQPTNITTEISIKPKNSAGAKLREELKTKQ